MKALIIIFMAGILTDNFVLQQFLGICPFLGVSNKLKSAVGMGVAVTIVMTLSTIVTWPIQHHILEPYGLVYLQTLVFILLIAAIVQVLESVIHKHMPPLYRALGVYLPLITTNCAVLGVTVLNVTEGYSYTESIVNALGGGIGFLVAMVLFAGVRMRLEEVAEPSSSFKGVPITLLSASVLSLAFFGFTGIVENVFA